MAESAYSYLVLPDIYHSTPLRALRMAARRKLSCFLDLEGSLVVCGQVDIVNDYTGLAELAGFTYPDILHMKLQKSPTTELLEKWTGRPNSATVGILWQFLSFMERLDVLSDCRACIIHDCEEYDKQQTLERDAHLYDVEQDPTVSTTEMLVDETRYVSIEDVTTGRRTYYDAFICYTQNEDREFLFELIRVLEQERKLKLFVPGRDDLPGSADHTITAYLIEKRCRRIVIIISRKFLQSGVCDFQLKFAHALSPGARSKRLIPVVQDEYISIPKILLGRVVVDFSKSDIIEWSWNRIYNAIIAPTDSKTYFEADDPSNPFELEKSLKQIAYPTNRRMVENEDQSEDNAQFADAGTTGSLAVDMRTRMPIEHEMYSSQRSARIQSHSRGTNSGVSMSAQNRKSQSQTPTGDNLTLKRAITRFKTHTRINPRKQNSKGNALI